MANFRAENFMVITCFMFKYIRGRFNKPFFKELKPETKSKWMESFAETEF